MSPKVPESHSEARREQILLAAMTCFANKGFHKTSMQDICKAAQLSPGAVYSYFESKDAIIEALAGMSEDMNMQNFDFSGAQEFASPQASFAHSLGLFINQYKNPMMRTGARMGAMFHAEALTNARLAELAERNYKMILDRIVELVASSQACGAIDPALNTRAVAQVLFSLVQGLESQIVLAGDDTIDVDAYLKASVAMVTRDIFSRPSNKPSDK